ncbi:MAG: bifunctional diaminohydroxyphosphoribosylaminopyrimidine deaminase/5-amino-6-(5-phosphoribosylamino)uracil reductase RibD [bacterium]|nr:bifunctional diaminohydroxyphosphoribosylaminopyrimidine deaminase/5-amino-6-(5-phosphoribosylamino)uracil reductase RibD [bacterium]
MAAEYNREFMERAIELAHEGEGFVNPNPLVGAVIVRDGKIIGEGYHARYGGLHAERNALKNCAENPRGAEMYVTLEPCCHYGKNPPCTEAVINAGISRVYVGSADPNPLVAGKGIAQLRSAGIEVVENVMRKECDALNDIFFHYITTGLPYVILKTAMSADGKTAAYTGHSQWITNEKSRADVHKTRKRAAAIMVGIGTVLADDPMLNCRYDNPSNPVRIVCDTKLHIPINSKIVRTAREIPTYIATQSQDKELVSELQMLGVNILHMPTNTYDIDLKYLMRILGRMKIDSVLIEGGASLHTSALKYGIVNKVQIYVAPKIIGQEGRSAFGPMGVKTVDAAFKLSAPKLTMFDNDILIEYEVK